MTGKFVIESGDGWTSVAYVSPSIGMTIFFRPNTDQGISECNEMLKRIERMTEQEKQDLVMRRIKP